MNGNFVQRSEPGGGDQGRIAGSNSASFDRASQFGFDQFRELTADENQVVAECPAGARHFDQDDARERMVSDENVNQAQQRGVEAFDRRVRRLHLALNGLGELAGEFPHQGPKDGGLAGKVKIGRALGTPGAVNDLVHGRAVVALFPKDVEGGFQQGVAGGVLAAGRRPSRETETHGLHQTDWSVGFTRGRRGCQAILSQNPAVASERA